MIVTTRTLTCNYCGDWVAIGDTETARDARRRVQPRGWRKLPDPNDRRRSLDACPRHPEGEPTAVQAARTSDAATEDREGP